MRKASLHKRQLNQLTKIRQELIYRKAELIQNQKMNSLANFFAPMVHRRQRFPIVEFDDVTLEHKPSK